MSEVKWIKISINILNDEKIKLIDSMPEADAIFRIWIGLLSLAAKTNDNGLIYLSKDIPYTDEMFSTILHRPLNIIRLALGVFVNFEMIEIDNKKNILIKNWHKHQNLEGLEKIREQNRIRQERYREKQKEITNDINKDIDKNRIEENVTSNVIFSCNYFSIFKGDYEKYKELYMGIDLMKEFKRMEIWLDANPSKRKTKRGYPRFIVNWLNRTKGDNKKIEKIEIPEKHRINTKEVWL